MERLVTRSQTSDWSKPGLQEYLLVAHPDASVNAKVMAQKESFYSEYGQKVAIKTKPHITIVNFLAREAMEETIIRYMHRIFIRKQSFEVALNNYSGIPPHTVYLRVQNPQPFKQLAKELKVVDNYVSSCSCPPVSLKTNPHVSIARRLPETLYMKAMMDYSQRTFYETFFVNELVLLRRDRQYDSCKPVQVFCLQPPGYKTAENMLCN